MCTIVHPNATLQVTTDIIPIYKIAIRFRKGVYESPFFSSVIILNQLYKTDITFSDVMNIDLAVPMSVKETDNFLAFEGYYCKEARKGFHSFLDEETCKSELFDKFDLDITTIFEGYIPVDSLVVYGYNNNIVSDQVIYTKQLCVH